MSNPTISSEYVDVWRATINPSFEQPDTWHTLLSFDETARAHKFHFERDRQRFIHRRGILRTILAHYTMISPQSLDFDYGKHGKPVLLKDGRESSLQFNMSHSGDISLIAVSYRRAVGIDVEQIRPVPNASEIVQRNFTAREIATWQALPPEHRQAAFFATWTRKEALLKAWGIGLTLPINQFSVTLSPCDSPQVETVDGDHRAVDHWALTALTPLPGYVGALAVEGDGWQVRYYEWSDDGSSEFGASLRPASA